MKKLLLLGIIALMGTAEIFTQELRVVKGGVVDSIAVNDSLKESFSLYLPKNFTSDRPWPVLVIFDPEGRGKLAAQLFRSIAEEQGYMIVASNAVLESDSLQANLPKARRLLHRIFASLPVDTSMVYAGGLAEGGELASAIPFLFTNIAGVMAIGEAMVNPEFMDQDSTFYFSGLAGDEDFQMGRMTEMVTFFKRSRFPAEINYYEGKKEDWPNPGSLSNAVTGFTLEAMINGHRKKDPAFVEFLFKNELVTVELLERYGRFYQAFEKLKQLEEKYASFAVNKELLKNSIRSLRKNKAFRRQRREFRRAAVRESEKQEEYRYYLETDLLSHNFENLGWWEFQVEELEEQQNKGNLAEQKMAARLQSFLQQLSKNTFKEVIQSEAGIDIKIFISVLRTILEPEDSEAYLKIIALAGADGDHQTALLYLEDLLKTGFDDLEALYKLEGIMDLKFSPAYNETIRIYLGTSKYHQALSKEKDS